MEYINNLLEKRNMHQLILVVLFIIYLIMGYKMPDNLADMIDSSMGKVIVAISALLLFAYSNPILGVLGLLVAFQLLKSASEKTGMAAMEQFYPNENTKWKPFTPAHQFPDTLEQEVVKKMASQKFNDEYEKPPYVPILEDNYNAESLQ